MKKLYWYPVKFEWITSKKKYENIKNGEKYSVSYTINLIQAHNTKEATEIATRMGEEFEKSGQPCFGKPDYWWFYVYNRKKNILTGDEIYFDVAWCVKGEKYK